MVEKPAVLEGVREAKARLDRRCCNAVLLAI